MMLPPQAGQHYRSILTGENARVMDVRSGGIIVILKNGDRSHVLIRDFNAEYRLIEQRRAVA